MEYDLLTDSDITAERSPLEAQAQNTPAEEWLPLQLGLPLPDFGGSETFTRPTVKPSGGYGRGRCREGAGQETSPPQQQRLLAELLQLRSQVHSQVSRIRSLEQALDQSLVHLKELRQQLIDQQFLEDHLAATEEIANIQQQAIYQLKAQLATKQQIIEANQTELRQQQQELQVAWQRLAAAGISLDLPGEGQSKLNPSRAPLTDYPLEPSTIETLLAQQRQYIAELEAAAALRAGWETSLIEMLVSTQTTLTTLVEISALAPVESSACGSELMVQLTHCLAGLTQSLEQAPLAKQHNASSPTSAQELIEAQKRIGELETQLAHQETARMLLQHTYQEMETERDRQRQRLQDLEAQVAEMQEQILHQAQQASEYETAVQHWKDRYVGNYQQIQQLRQILEATLPTFPVEVEAILATLEASRLSAMDQNPASALVPARFNRDSQLDLPEFLLRRRRYKAQRLS